MTWYLEYSTAGGEKKQIRIDQPALRIGRGTGSDTRIEDASMSRLHCLLAIENDVPVLSDLGSSTGTFIQSKKITTSVTLNSGQSFKAGNTRFKIISDSPLDAPTQFGPGPSTTSDLKHLADKLQSKGTLDRFVLKRLVNATGRNLVFRADDPENEETVALKIIPTDEGTDEDEARFLRAMEMLQAVRDPCLVRLIRAGRRKRFCWVAMEWYEDGSLEDRVEKYGINGCLDWKDAWRVAYCISQSLHILEREKIVHRNIKPTNILAHRQRGQYVLSDLVVAKAQHSKATNLVTRQVFLPSELAYTAPERLLGAETNEYSLQSDIYSLGAVLTHLLTGEPPYGRGDLRMMLDRMKQRRHLVSVEGQLGINELFVDLVNNMTEPEASRRFATAYKLWLEVERVGKLAGLNTI